MKFAPHRDRAKAARIALPGQDPRLVFYEICEETELGPLILVSPQVLRVAKHAPEVDIPTTYLSLAREGALFLSFLRAQPWAEAVVLTHGHLIPVPPEALDEIFPEEDRTIMNALADILLRASWPEWPPPASDEEENEDEAPDGEDEDVSEEDSEASAQVVAD